VLPPLGAAHDRGLSVPSPLKFGRLLEGWGELHRPVLHGLLREGETMNVIAARKFGKSWLVTDLALAIVTGSHWLGRYAAEPGEVLIIDNELHKETSAYRILKVLAARGYPLGTICEHLEIVHLRGHLRDIHAYGPGSGRSTPCPGERSTASASLAADG
jgi:RecA-family ATPase